MDEKRRDTFVVKVLFSYSSSLEYPPCPFFASMKQMHQENDMYEQPLKQPEPGYYYHYKHKADGTINNYAYYIYGVGHHTERDCRPQDKYMQVYRPLYEDAYVYKNGKMFDLRPLYMFYDPAIVNGVSVARFTKITHPAVIAELRSIRERLYPQE
jgi:hypothetical protein